MSFLEDHGVHFYHNPRATELTNVHWLTFSINPTNMISLTPARAFETKLADRYHRSPFDEQEEGGGGGVEEVGGSVFSARRLSLRSDCEWPKDLLTGVVRTRLEGWWERASVRFSSVSSRVSLQICLLFIRRELRRQGPILSTTVISFIETCTVTREGWSWLSEIGQFRPVDRLIRFHANRGQPFGIRRPFA